MPTTTPSTDYYAVLGVGKSATEKDIRTAYRNLAKVWHPDKHPNKEVAQVKFQEIGKAYEVLSNPEKRKVYDMYGEDGLQGGMSGGPSGGPSGNMPGGAQFDQRAAEDIFRRFFGAGGAGGDDGSSDSGTFSFGGMPRRGAGTKRPNPFGAAFGGGAGPNIFGFPGAASSSEEESEPMDTSFDFGGMGGMGGFGGFGGHMGGRRFQQQQQQQPESEVLQRKLPVSLEELYAGTTKRLKVTKNIQDSATGIVTPSSTVLTVEVKRGWRSGTRVTFPNAGDELNGRPRQDIQFVIEEKPHPVYKREGDNLHTTIRVPLVDALCGSTQTLETLDGRKLAFKEDSISPDAIKIVPNEGMPNKHGGKGDLYIHYNIAYPTNLTDTQKQKIRGVLPRQ